MDEYRVVNSGRAVGWWVGAVPVGSPCSVKCGHTGTQWRFPEGLQYRSKQRRLGRDVLVGIVLGRKLCRL